MTESFFLKSPSDVISTIKSKIKLLEKKLKNDIDFHKNFGMIDLLVPYYVIPFAQNLNPADTMEMDTGLIARNDIFSLLNHFLIGDARYSHAFILSDAGMGKTSLLTMIKLAHMIDLTVDKYNVELFKLGEDTFDELDRIHSANNTILLLDALDEDAEAWENFYTRLQLILQKTKPFRKVIITCRTQFFPHSHEEDGKVPGQISLHGFKCSKLFLSPFNDYQVKEYLQNKFKSEEKILKAQKIVDRMRSLRFRPMLLSYIDLLLNSMVNYTTAYAIYEDLVNEWLNRELRKGVIKNKKPLINACKILAFQMYDNNKSRHIDEHRIWELTKQVDDMKELPYLSLEGRSLLNITSDKRYKFAHFSIQEFFVTQKLLNWNPRIFIENTDQVVNFINDYLSYNKLSSKNLTKLDLKKSNLQNVNLSSHAFDSASFMNSKISNVNFASSTFVNTNLSKSTFIHCSFAKSKLFNSLIKKSIFLESDFSGAILRNLDEEFLDFENSKFENTIFEDCKFNKIKFNNCTFIGSKISKNTEIINSFFNKAKFSNLIWNNICLIGSQANGSFLENCSFSEVNFDKSIFSQSELKNSSYINCKLCQSNFSNSRIMDLNLKKCNLSSSDFSHATIQKSEFDEISFDKSTLTNSVFIDCKMTEVDFSNANLSVVKFNNCQVQHIKFDDSSINVTCRNTDISNSSFKFGENNNLKSIFNFQSTKLSENKLENLNVEFFTIENSMHIKNIYINNSKVKNFKLSNVSIEGLIFSGRNSISNFEGINCSFLNCNFDWVAFKNLNLTNCNFTNCSFKFSSIKSMKNELTKLQGCNFENARFEVVDFSSINLQDIILHKVSYTIKTKWPKSFDYQNLKAYGPYAIHKNNSYIKKDMSGEDMQYAILTNITKGKMNFVKTNLYKANLENSSFTESNFTFSNLSHANLKNVNLYRCDLRGVKLLNANLTNSNLGHSDLREADLTSCILNNTKFRRALYNKKTIFPKNFSPKKHEMRFTEE